MAGCCLKRGQETCRGDLQLFTKSRDGTPKDAAEISYSIFDFTTGTEVLMPPANREPINPAVGEYYANFVIPPDANIGQYRIRWYFREYIGSQEIEVLQEFSIVESATQVVTIPGITAIEYDLIRSLRILLRDNNPDRNYHFVPPTGEESINQFTRVFGYIWLDDELLEFLRISNDSINMYPPATFYSSLDDIIGRQRSWRSLLLIGAMIHAINALSLNWIADEFDYSIGGVSLSIEKSSKYQSMAGDAQARFESMVEAAKETVKIMRGLKQSRYGVGIRSSFGPSTGRGALTPRRFLGI
jgi:hypothetical protein